MSGCGASIGNSSLRRGNTIVLVMGILVLLAIIGTAYVSRTQAGRVTGPANQRADMRENTAQIVGDMIARDLADALFVRQIDTSLPVADVNEYSNLPRLPIFPNAVRHGVDPNFPFNAPPFHVVPYTNWFDLIDGSPLFTHDVPLGPGCPGGGGNDLFMAPRLAGEGNPVGPPGFGDSRWLRDTEPHRYVVNFEPGVDKSPNFFSHWRHLTNLSRPDNAFRICTDISNLDRDFYSIGAGGQLDGLGGVVLDLAVPIEQWLSVKPANHSFVLSPSSPGNVDAFWRQWWNRFHRGRYLATYANNGPGPSGIAPNFYRLNDLDNDGFIHNYIVGGVPQDRPESEFIFGTARNLVSRVLTDTDGDGFTDAFWHLAPISSNSGTRTLVAVSVIDNHSMLNVNVATRFFRDDDPGPMGVDPQLNPAGLRRTAGHTASDLALTGQMSPLTSANEGRASNYNVGYFDNPHHDQWSSSPNFDYNVAMAPSLAGQPNLGPWQRFASETGLPMPFPSNRVPTVLQRLDYWRRAANQPNSVDLISGYRPFTLADEIDLRSHFGNNHAWIFSRFESTFGNYLEGSQSANAFIRSGWGVNWEEMNEYQKQLSNAQLVADHRHRLTTYNSVRNELVPPWLWRFRAGADLNGNTVLDAGDHFLFVQGAQKFDLRMPYGSVFYADIVDNVTGLPPADGFVDFPTTGYRYLPNWGPGFAGFPLDPIPFDPLNLLSKIRLGEALRDHTERALMDFDADDDVASAVGLPGLGMYAETPLGGPFPGGRPRGTYYGVDAIGSLTNANKTRELAASFAANVLQWRDRQLNTGLLPGIVPEELSLLSESVPVKGNPSVRFMGMEPQPFIVEAFIGHIYKTTYVPEGATDPDGQLYGNGGKHVLFNHETRRSTVVVVQIANPYNRPINLSPDPSVIPAVLPRYRLRVFGQDLEFSNQNHFVGGAAAWDFNTFLLPATDDQPNTAIFYAIKDEIDGEPLHDEWVDFLDLLKESTTTPGLFTQFGADGVPNTADDDHPAGTIIRRVSAWSTDRGPNNPYDDDLGESDVELHRLDPEDPASGRWVVIDRMDSPSQRTFREAVQDLDDFAESDVPSDPPGVYDILQDFEPYGVNPEGGVTMTLLPGQPAEGDRDHWIQWVRATRAWGADLDGEARINQFGTAPTFISNGEYDENERNPRYVFGHRAVISVKKVGPPAAVDETYAALDPQDTGMTTKFNRYDIDDEPDPTTFPQANKMKSDWFNREYFPCQPFGGVQFARKPTFFDFNRRFDYAWVTPHLAGTPPPAPIWSYPDKGWYTQGNGPDEQVRYDDPSTIFVDEDSIRTDFAMQMLHKDGDFEQVGELLNVFLYGHKIESDGATVPPIGYSETLVTFSEFMTNDDPSPALPNYDQLVGQDVMVNRLRLRPSNLGGTIDTFEGGFVVGTSGVVADYPNLQAYLADSRQAVPDLPAGVRLLDAFVCDRWGVEPLADLTGPNGLLDGAIDFYDNEFRSFKNAKNFDGTGTPGLINLNTAPMEVMRALPHWYRLVHESGFGFLPNGTPILFFNNHHPMLTPAGMAAGPPQPLVTDGGNPDALLPRVMLPEALWHYRDQLNGYDPTAIPPPPNPNGFLPGPVYEERWRRFAAKPFHPADPVPITEIVRGDRGLASIGEILMLKTTAPRAIRVPADPTIADYIYPGQWQYDAGAAAISADRNRPFWNQAFDPALPPVAPGSPHPNQRDQVSMRISTDRTNEFSPDCNGNGIADYLDILANPGLDLNGNRVIDACEGQGRPDLTAGDAEEANMLFAGASNLITTRSDTFTVYFRIRTIRQNPQGPGGAPVWDATNPDYILDDSRYVMLVDRSMVNRPTDRPKILYLEKLPN